MEGESPLFRRGGSLPPNLPLSPRTSPMPPPFLKWKFDSLFVVAGIWGKFFVFGEVKFFCSVRLSHSFCGWDTFRRYTLHECRQAESRHSSKVSSPNVSRLQIGCEAVLCKGLAPPNPTKNFPQEHPQKAKRTKFTQCKGGCSWGKFSEEEGGLEGEGPRLSRGVPLPSRSFLFPSKVFPALTPDFFAEKT